MYPESARREENQGSPELDASHPFNRIASRSHHTGMEVYAKNPLPVSASRNIAALFAGLGAPQPPVLMGTAQPEFRA